MTTNLSASHAILDGISLVKMCFFKWVKRGQDKKWGFSSLVLVAATMVLALPVRAASPDCGGENGWAVRMALTQLKNNGLLPPERSDVSPVNVVRLASERIGKDLYRQIYKITFADKAGNTIEVLTMNNASNVECSESGVEVFVVSKDLGSITQ